MMGVIWEVPDCQRAIIDSEIKFEKAQAIRAALAPQPNEIDHRYIAEWQILHIT
jgi:hypothetical protein